uniref:Kynureninase n=1 Tax=Myripristis murdjan TaxID=586833 RepID=A0A668AMI0_9TELE
MSMQFSSLPAEGCVAATLGCAPTSRDVAAYLDQHDELRHMRDEFLVPKISDLPPCRIMLLRKRSVRGLCDRRRALPRTSEEL